MEIVEVQEWKLRFKMMIVAYRESDMGRVENRRGEDDEGQHNVFGNTFH